MRPNIIRIKKKSFLLLIVLCYGITSLAQNTIVTKTIKPLQDAIPVVCQNNVKGGFHQVSDTTDIASELRTKNMLVWQNNDHACFQWNGANWEKVKIVRGWADGLSFYTGDLFLYNNTLVIAKTESTIASDDNPLTDTANWVGILPASLDSGTQEGNTLFWNGLKWKESGELTIDNNKVTVNDSLLIGNKIIFENGATINNGSTHTVNVIVDTLAVSGNIVTDSGAVITSATNASLFNSGATTLDIGGASDSTTIGSSDTSAVTIVANNLKIGNPTVDKITMDGGALMVEGDTEIDGTIWVKDLQTSSDKRLKTNIETLTKVLKKLEKLRGVSYEFRDQKKYASGAQVGVIAQELQAAYPQLVAQSADGYLTVNYPQLTAVLLQAIKEQQVQIENINNKFDKIEQRLKKLESE